MGRRELRMDHVAVRLDDVTIARLDALLPLYTIPGRAATRSDGLRALILAGLDVEERRAANLARARWDALDEDATSISSDQSTPERSHGAESVHSQRRRP